MTEELWEFVKLWPLGFGIGIYGTLVGAGGGFLLVPALLMLMPEKSPAEITAIALAVVFFNSYAGSVAYIQTGRIDYYAALLFALAGLPCAAFGPWAISRVERSLFDPVFGLLLLSGAVWLAVKPRKRGADQPVELTERGHVYFNTLVGSVGISYIGMGATLFGLGGGVIYVPFLIRVLRFPPHVATATTQLILVVFSFVAIISHIVLGSLSTGINETLFLAVGVMMGAPLGALFSARLEGSALVRLLALALTIAGLRLVLRNLLG